MSIKIAVLGYGRMGKEVERCVFESEELHVAGVWVRRGGADDGAATNSQSTDLQDVLSRADVAIDFTLPAVTAQVLAAVAAARIPLVCGVSGLTAAHRQRMTRSVEHIPILYDRNMSLGVAVMRQLVHLAGSVFGNEFEAEIHETHHVHKVDAPSGTALLLGESLAAGRGQKFADVYQYDKDSDNPLKPGGIRYKVTRAGEVPGEHTVLFRSADETLSLKHEVADRRVFAAGGIAAARWLVSQPPGLYSMQDMIVNAESFPAASFDEKNR